MNCETSSKQPALHAEVIGERVVPVQCAYLLAGVASDHRPIAVTGLRAGVANKMLTKKYRKGFVIEGEETLG